MEIDSNKKVIVADICNTLYDSNTTYDFIKYCIDTNKLPMYTRVAHGGILFKVSPLFWAIAVSEKIVQKDIFKTLVVRFLRGRTVQEVKAWSEQFYNDYLKRRAINPSFSVLKEFNPEDIILVSSTLYPIAATIAENLNIEKFLATDLEVKDGCYTGRIINELSGRKLAALKDKYRDGMELELVISDNFTDKELMQHSKKRIAVCYNKKHEKFWATLPHVTILNIPTPIGRI